MQYFFSHTPPKGKSKIVVHDESILCTSAVVHTGGVVIFGGKSLDPLKSTDVDLPAGEIEVECPNDDTGISITWHGEIVAEKTRTLDQELSEPKREEAREESRQSKNKKKTEETAPAE